MEKNKIGGPEYQQQSYRRKLKITKIIGNTCGVVNCLLILQANTSLYWTPAHTWTGFWLSLWNCITIDLYYSDNFRINYGTFVYMALPGYRTNIIVHFLKTIKALGKGKFTYCCSLICWMVSNDLLFSHSFLIAAVFDFDKMTIKFKAK